MILNDYSLNMLKQQNYLQGYVGPASIDLKLSDSYFIPKVEGIHYLENEIQGEQIIKSRYLLQSGQFILASTQELIQMPNDKAGLIVGRSSIGRLGLQIENAGFVDPGFCGQITLELCNQAAYPIMLEQGTRICQLIVLQLNNEADCPYNMIGKYHDQQGATPSKLYEDLNV